MNRPRTIGNSWRTIGAVFAMCVVAKSVQAADPTPEEVFDRAVANLTNHVIHSGCAELEERVEVKGQPSQPVSRRIVFEGDFNRGTFRDEFAMSPKQPPILMMGCGSGRNRITLTAIADHSNVNIKPSLSMPAAFEHFGRLGNNYQSVEPLPSVVRFTRSVRLIGSEPFEGSTVQIIEVTTWNKPRQKAWIDPARGYICPRHEFCEGQLLVDKTEASGFFVEPASQLYFPEHYVETLFDRKSGAPQITWRYCVDPKTLKLNYAIADEEFSITVPKRGIIKDEREGGRDYRATEDVRIAFNDKLDLAKIAALEATSAPRPKKPPTVVGKMHFGALATGFIVALAAALPIALVIFVLIVRRISKPRVIEAEAVNP
ncbi:MAG TPA: hypothetical protein VGZ26_07200 [Pirellulales bacterium]|nr:hypothetical protein [Pirellulales bacterium]